MTPMMITTDSPRHAPPCRFLLAASRRLAIGVLAGLLALCTAQVVCAAQVAGTAPARDEESDDPITRASQAFAGAEAEVKMAVIADIARRVEDCEDEALLEMIALRDRARKELKVRVEPAPAYHDADRYAPGLYKRRFADPKADRTEIEMTVARFRPWESEPPFYARVVYDFGFNGGDRARDPLPPEEALENFLFGYPEGSDVLVAWLASQWDFDSSLDKMADHFAKAYVTLDSTAFREVTLFDVFASREKHDMHDVDVIAYALLILDDTSYVSPIPPDRRRKQLYDKVQEGFLAYYRHRTWIEAAANLYVNPEATLRLEHGPLRRRLLYAFALDDGEVEAIGERLAKSGDRQTFIRATDRLAIDDPAEDLKRNRFVKNRNDARWAVARCAHAVLREYGFLQSDE